MGVLYSIGKTLVSRDELLEKASTGRLRDFANKAASDKSDSIRFGDVEVTTKDLPAKSKDAIPFTPIGLNKPLTVEFLSAYMGDAPGRSFFDTIFGRSNPDLLIVSGSKNPTKSGPAPRAINQIVKDIEDKKRYSPGAFRTGSPIIYYSPAITDPTTYVSVEMVVDSFSGDLLTQMEGLFRSAASLPVFAPAAAYLLAGATLAKMGKNLIESLTETGAFLKADVDILLDSAGFPVDLARFMVFAADSDLPKLAGYEAKVITTSGDSRVTLIQKQSGEEYDGDVPYVITSLDGASHKKYENFAPQHASAAMLEQFYGTDTLTGVADVLKESLTLYNDLRFRKSADRLKKELKDLKEGSEEFKKLKERLDAYKANIMTDELKEGL